MPLLVIGLAGELVFYLRFTSRWRFLIKSAPIKLSLANGFNSFLIDGIKRLTRIAKAVLKWFRVNGLRCVQGVASLCLTN
jgi:hypothetical protein